MSSFERRCIGNVHPKQHVHEPGGRCTDASVCVRHGRGRKGGLRPRGKDCLHGIRAGSAPHPALQLFTPTATHPRHRRMQGFLNAVSYANPSAPHLLKDHTLGFGRSLTDASICGGLLAVSMPAAVKTDPGPRLCLSPFPRPPGHFRDAARRALQALSCSSRRPLWPCLPS